MKKIKVGILGVGAIGSVIASQLFENRNIDLLYFNRSTKIEIRLQSPERFFDFKIKTQTKVIEKIELDWLIICLKEYHFKEAQSWFEQLIFPKTKIAVIRNGIDLKKPLLPFAKENNIFECMIDCPTQLSSDGSFHQLKNAIITSLSGNLVKQFELLFFQKKIIFHPIEDFKTENWKKLLESAAIGAITCLTGETCWVFKDKKIRKLYQNLIEEGIQVAKMDGAIIPSDFVNIMLEKIKTYPKQKGTSMLTDRKLGRPIELGAKNGAISRMGKIYKIETPLNDLVCTLLEKTNKS